MHGFTQRQGRVILRGLLVVLVPTVVVVKSLEHAHKALSSAMNMVDPQHKVAGDISIAVILLVAILGACWFLGWLITRTELGQRVLEWERVKFVNRSPLLKKQIQHAKNEEKETSDRVKEAQPALARLAGG